MKRACNIGLLEEFLNCDCRKKRVLSTLVTGGRVILVKALIWYFAKGLEASALGVVGYALYVGLQSSDPTTEMKWLMPGAVIFMVGLALERVGGGES